MVHGDQDPVVPLQQSEVLYQALKKAGVQVKLHVARGGKHGFGSPGLNQVMLQFFENHL